MKNAWKEFKAFAMGGNMLDLALGFIIGAAFATLVESLASNILMQLVAAIVKLLKKAGMGNFRAQGQRECPMCKEFVAVDALKCKWCTADIDPDQAEEEDLEIIEARRKPEQP